MKEATGELAGSVIVVAAVAVLTAFFFTIIWPMVRTGMEDRATCANAVCDIGYNENGMAWCYSPSDTGDDKDFYECPFKG
jgi:hypothetical protein